LRLSKVWKNIGKKFQSLETFLPNLGKYLSTTITN